MGSTLLQSLPDAVQQIVKTDTALLASVACVLVLYTLFSFRDGRAVGTAARPDLSTVPGESSWVWVYRPVRIIISQQVCRSLAISFT